MKSTRAEPVFEIPGRLVNLPLPRGARPLDGFWSRGPHRRKTLLVFVHGMHSNFYRSTLKKTLMRECGRADVFDVLSFNNRGAEQETAAEHFSDCLADLDAALRFGHRHGYRHFVLVGHSTGCQKITYWQARRQDPSVRALVLLAIGDDLAIARANLGRRFAFWVRRARTLVARGRGKTHLPAACLGFTARRFLSVADPQAVEAALFDFEGPMTHFGRIRCPVLVIWAGKDEYETLSPARATEVLRKRSRSGHFDARIIGGANHGFRGSEARAVRALLGGLRTVYRSNS